MGVFCITNLSKVKFCETFIHDMATWNLHNCELIQIFQSYYLTITYPTLSAGCPFRLSNNSGMDPYHTSDIINVIVSQVRKMMIMVGSSLLRRSNTTAWDHCISMSCPGGILFGIMKTNCVQCRYFYLTKFLILERQIWIKCLCLCYLCVSAPTKT